MSSKDTDVIDTISKKYFSEIEHWVPHFQQTMFDLQNEVYKSWKNIINANISLHKEFLEKSGLHYPDSAKSIFESMSEETIKFRELYHKTTVSSIESGKKSIKTWNDNSDSFLDLNRKIMNYWLSAFYPQ